MLEHINWLAVFLASISTFILGGLWYSPMMFLNAWMKGMNISEEKERHPAKVFGKAFVFSLVSCIAMAIILGDESNIISGIKMGLLVGIGFVFCSFGINYQFANRPFNVLLIDGGYHVLQFVLFGVILVAL